MAPKRKGKKEKEVVAMTAEEIEMLEEHVQELVKPQLPIGRVKKICRLDPDVDMINSEATMLLAKAADLFIAELGKAANINAAHERRKTVQQKDIDKCIKKLWTFAFLEDALDGWPKSEPKKRKKPDENGTILEETHEGGSSQQTELDETNYDAEEADEVEEENDIEDEVVEESQEQVVETSQEDDDSETIESSEYVDKFAEQF